MTCPQCGEKTRVIYTRQKRDGRTIRRRECLVCRVRFTSWELPVARKL